jgi:hypothetical protein
MIFEKVKFTEDREVEAQGKIVKVFKAGEVYELPVPSARHWLKRNAAVRVSDEPEPEPEPERPAPKPVRTKRGRPSRAVKSEVEVKTADEPETDPMPFGDDAESEE